MVSESITKLFVEQPLASPGTANYFRNLLYLIMSKTGRVDVGWQWGMAETIQKSILKFHDGFKWFDSVRWGVSKKVDFKKREDLARGQPVRNVTILSNYLVLLLALGGV